MRVAAYDWPSSSAQKSPQEVEAERSTKQKLDVWGGVCLESINELAIYNRRIAHVV